MLDQKESMEFGEVIHQSTTLDQKPGAGSVDLCCSACCTCSAASVSGGLDSSK